MSGENPHNEMCLDPFGIRKPILNRKRIVEQKLSMMKGSKGFTKNWRAKRAEKNRHFWHILRDFVKINEEFTDFVKNNEDSSRIG